MLPTPFPASLSRWRDCSRECVQHLAFVRRRQVVAREHHQRSDGWGRGAPSSIPLSRRARVSKPSCTKEQ